MSVAVSRITYSTLDKYIASNNITGARDLLLKLILENGDFAKSIDSWSSYANKISVKLPRIKNRIGFWDELEKTIKEAEKYQKQSIYKGGIYWRLATLVLLDGEEYKKALSWLEQSYGEDLEYQKKNPKNYRSDELAKHNAKKMVAHRLKDFLSLIIDEVDNKYETDADLKVIKNFLSNKRSRRVINKFIAHSFDLHMENPNFFNKLTWAPFDRLIGRKPYRVHVQSFYDAAAWLVGKREELESSSLEKYGISYTIMMLAGTLIEGALLCLPKVKKEVSKTKGKVPTLGILVRTYFRQYKKRLPVEISFSLRIILYMRNRIHPNSFDKSIDHRIDMNFAGFIYRLAERTIELLAMRHTRKNPYAKS